MKWLDITDDLNEVGKKKLKVGQVLFFDNDTEFGIQLKIMRKNKGKVWAKQVYMYKPEEVFEKDKVE